jgi:hypothetical protein
MKRLTLTLMFFCVCCGLALAGPAYSGKEMKQVAPTPCPQWYADNEFNVNLWGTYAATGTEFAPNPSLADIVQSTTEGHTVYGTFDKYLGGDHAWGGGIDLKYFFHRYFGIGVEGFVLNAHRGAGFDLESNGIDVFIHEKRSESPRGRRSAGNFHPSLSDSVFSFFPLRLGRRRHHLGRWRTRRKLFSMASEVPEKSPVPLYHTVHHGTTTEAVGQFGGGLEFRVTPHIGWMNDFSWNVINGPQNNFGMVRSGLTFAF